MLDLGFVLLVALVSAGFGRRVVDRLAPGDGRFEDWALALPIGLGTLSLLLLGLAEIGHLDRSGMAIALISMFAIGITPLIDAARKIRPSLVRCHVRERFSAVFRRFPAGNFGRQSRPYGIDLFIGLILAGTLLTALGPVTDGDALCYHLQVPKVFLEARSAVFEPDLHETIYPLATEMLYALALAFRGPIACRLIQWVLGLSFAASVYSLGRPVLGDRARWASAIALGVPAISNGMGAPLNDVALAAFGNAALVSFLRWNGRPTIGSAALVGILSGMAIGVKYPALVWAGLIGLAMTARLPSRRAGSAGRGSGSAVEADRETSGGFGSDRPAEPALQIRHLAAFGIMAILIGGPWYLRAFHHTGNPVFPFFRGLFGAGIDDVLDPIKRPMTVTPWNLLTAIGPLTLDPARFESVAHQFGPAFLLFLPGLFLLKPARKIVGIALIGWAFLTLCLTQRQSMRFVLICIGPFSVATAWVASAWWDRGTRPARFLVGILLTILAAESTIAIARSRYGLPVVLGMETESHYLDRREPTYRVGRWMAGNLPESARVIGQDHRGFYLPRPYSMELAHRRRTGLGRRGESASEVIDQLRRDGFTHLMLCPPVPETAVEFDPTLGRLLEPWLADREPIYREEIADGDGVVRRYTIYFLDDTPMAQSTPPRARR